MSYLDRHSVALGALDWKTGSEWGQSQYKALATRTALSSPGTYVVVLVGRNGSFTRPTSYTSRSSMLEAWDRLRTPDLPHDVGYGLAYDKAESDPSFRVVEEGFNPLIGTWTKTTQKVAWRSLLPWGAAGLAVILAATYFKKGRRPTKAGKTLRMRRRPLWRKRVVTVWR